MKAALPSDLPELSMTSPITGLSSMAVRQILAELAAGFSRETGNQVAFTSVGGVEAARRIRSGEPADVVVLAAKAMEQLEAEGHLAPGTRTPFARSGIAMAVRAGLAHPSVADAAAVRQAILDADRLCYSTGPSGDHLQSLWEQWGIADAVRPRAVQAPPGVSVATVLARGDAEIGFQQLSEMLGEPGIEIVGPLPADIQAITIFTAGLSSRSLHPEKARALIAYLASQKADVTKRRHGMEPA
jgi:molybdate transport system substrate-binding protein